MNYKSEVTKKIYMLSGLGCDKSNVSELEKELNKFNYTIEYINTWTIFEYRCEGRKRRRF